ncbi:SUKH-3 domain-containing protein [Saccharothrix sp. S26]|uniref:SUKH-3 domain-containing protein n=1 Tax=Saccharothrix sp. S26 TaxID=2907215 RepID=UPI001F298EFA|nr:SUKH-3 domain-containing protein [Saccharothrix sp. S26]MCE6996709.1 SUKH-3 domain-containing protein [Saccharothrix sp. S26]
MDRWTAEAEQALRTAGWHPGRQVDTTLWQVWFEPDGLPMHWAAQRFLGEFGGLVFDISGPGITRAKEPFELDPMLCDGEDDRFVEWGADIGRSLFPIGELDHGRFSLGIDEDGFLYLVSDFLRKFGAGESGMEDLLLGVMGEEIDG